MPTSCPSTCRVDLSRRPADLSLSLLKAMSEKKMRALCELVVYLAGSVLVGFELFRNVYRFTRNRWRREVPVCPGWSMLVLMPDWRLFVQNIHRSNLQGWWQIIWMRMKMPLARVAAPPGWIHIISWCVSNSTVAMCWCYSSHVRECDLSSATSRTWHQIVALLPNQVQASHRTPHCLCVRVCVHACAVLLI